MPRRLSSTAAAALAIALVGTAPAIARPALEPPAARTTQAQPVTQPIDEGFEWASAVVGAGGATLVFILAGAGTVTLSRRHHHIGTVR